MERRRLGERGPLLSVVGLGCNNFGPKLDGNETRAVVHAALDAGINHFDTAELYGRGRSEEQLGAALGARRDEAVIASKYAPRPADEPYEPGAVRRRIRSGCARSLERLRTDRIDLYYLHFPDPHPEGLAEALAALDELVVEGKVLALASSNLDAGEIRAAASLSSDAGTSPFTGTQVEWNLLERGVEADVVPAAVDAGIGIVPYSPLASGMLTGKYRRDEAFPDGSRLATMPYFTPVATDRNFDRVAALTAFAEARGRTLLELAMGWLASQPVVASVIAGATSPAQVAANVAAAEWRLTPEDVAAVPAD